VTTEAYTLLVICYKEHETSPIPHVGNIGAAQNVSKITLRFRAGMPQLATHAIIVEEKSILGLTRFGRAMDGTCFPKLFGDGYRAICVFAHQVA
jgi:hypothetical protein